MRKYFIGAVILFALLSAQASACQLTIHNNMYVSNDADFYISRIVVGPTRPGPYVFLVWGDMGDIALDGVIAPSTSWSPKSIGKTFASDKINILLYGFSGYARNGMVYSTTKESMFRHILSWSTCDKPNLYVSRDGNHH